MMFLIPLAGLLLSMLVDIVGFQRLLRISGALFGSLATAIAITLPRESR